MSEYFPSESDQQSSDLQKTDVPNIAMFALLAKVEEDTTGSTILRILIPDFGYQADELTTKLIRFNYEKAIKKMEDWMLRRNFSIEERLNSS